MTHQSSVSFTTAYVQESQDQFLALFPHRYDYIWAEHPTPGTRPAWQTESRHPLSDRLIQQGQYLYGVRFGAETRYALLDIDAGSAYHPQRDAFAIPNLIAALEPLGLVNAVTITSSQSGGLHLYFPFDEPCSSWQIAIAIATTLETAGFKIYPGQLEVFPNPKPYSPDGTPSLFNAHRLPLQTASYLLNATFQPIWTTQAHFLSQWQFVQSNNHLDTNVLKTILKQVKRQHMPVTGKADKFIHDLNAEIELGWTGPGQTNRLLGRITMREYIFRHVLSGGEPRTGQILVDAIVAVARSLPGYAQWCRHQHEIVARVEEWVNCIENSYYFPYGCAHGKFQAKGEAAAEQSPSEAAKALEAAIQKAPTWNQQRSASARDRIRYALTLLLESDSLPAKPTARFRALLSYGIGGGSLYRHRDLWHPNYLDQPSPDPQITVGVDVGAKHSANNPCTFPELNPECFAQLNESIPTNTSILKDESLDNHGFIHGFTHEGSTNKDREDQSASQSTAHCFSVENRESVENPPDPRSSYRDAGCDCVAASHPASLTSLFPSADGNPLSAKEPSDLNNATSTVAVGNLSQPQPGPRTLAAETLHQTLANLKVNRQTEQAIQREIVRQAQQQRLDQQQAAAKAQKIQRMQQFFASSDPILQAEAHAWAQMNPGVLH